MSTTRTIPTKGSANHRGRGHGRGGGRQTSANFTFSRPNLPHEEDMDENYSYNGRRMGSHNQYQGSNQSSNRRRSNYKGNKNGNVRSYSSNSNTDGSSSHGSNSSGIPKHAQNPFFVGELLSRFNNMLPSSAFAEDEVVVPTSPKVLSNGNPAPDLCMFDSPSNNCILRRSSNSNSDSNNGLFHQFENTIMYSNHGNNGLKRGSNRNMGKNQSNSTIEGQPQRNYRFEETLLSPSILSRSGRSENTRRVNDHANIATSGYSEPQYSNFLLPSRACDRNTSASSNKSNNSPTIKKNIPFEKRKEIMKSFGFNIESLDKQSSYGSASKATDTNKIPQSFPHGFISSRTSSRMRHKFENGTALNSSPDFISGQNRNGSSKFNPENRYTKNGSMLDVFLADVEKCSNNNFYNTSPNSAKPSQNTNASNVSHGKSSNENVNQNERKDENTTQRSAISDTFFNQLDIITTSTNNQGISRTQPSNMSARKLSNSQEVRVNRHSRSKDQNFNPFLKTGQNSKSQDHFERSNSPRQRRQKIDPNLNPVVPYLDNSPGLTEKGFAGRNQFSVHRPVRDANERVPSRTEALARLEDKYKIQRAEYEAKKKEKEAKKRQEYLAKYQHVDQGYRLNDGLLDEAAGYAPGFIPMETVEDVRQRQQEQLRLAALEYQEQKKEEEERQKRIQEKKAKEKLENNRHYDAGYRLGHGYDGGPMGNSRQTPTQKSNLKKSSHHGAGQSVNNRIPNSLSPELMLEGETEEEALQRQEEQLILEMVIQSQQYNNIEAFTKKESSEEYEGHQPQSVADSNQANSTVGQTPRSLPVNTVEKTLETPNRGTSGNAVFQKMSQSGNSSREIPESSLAKSPGNIEKITEQMKNIGKHITSKDLKPLDKLDHFGTKRPSDSPQLQQLVTKVSRNSVSQVPPTNLGASSPEMSPKKAASVILKNQNGAVLVIRPTPEDLNQTLARRLEVQDEMDKQGYSTSYKPQAEETPLYSNNRFERKPNFDPMVATGAIPKKPSPTKTALPAAAANTCLSNTETPNQEEPVIDHKAELRAARLRFQQQYEETLRKKQEQKNEP